MLDLIAPAACGLDRLLIAAVGKPGDAKAVDLEALGGSIAVRLRSLGVGRASVLVDDFDGLPLAGGALAAALALGAELRSYRFTRYRTRKEENDDGEVGALTFLLGEHEAAADAYAIEAAVVEGVRHARDLLRCFHMGSWTRRSESAHLQM